MRRDQLPQILREAAVELLALADDIERAEASRPSEALEALLSARKRWAALGEGTRAAAQALGSGDAPAAETRPPVGGEAGQAGERRTAHGAGSDVPRVLRERILRAVDDAGGSLSVPDFYDAIVRGRSTTERAARTAVWTLIQEGALDLDDNLRLARGPAAKLVRADDPESRAWWARVAGDRTCVHCGHPEREHSARGCLARGCGCGGFQEAA